jgi:hypothetical protein
MNCSPACGGGLLAGNRGKATMPDTNDQGETFGEWLLAQKDRGGAIGALVAATKADLKFPRRGSPESVRKRLNEMQADGDMHDAVEDTETDWRAC